MSKLIGSDRRLNNALESIANAAEVFEILELNDAAEAATSLLESVAASIEKIAASKKKTIKKKTPNKRTKQISVKKNPVKPLIIIEEEEDPFTRNLNSVKQLENIKNVGWPFNAPQIINEDEEDCMADDYSWLDDNSIDDYSWAEDNNIENYAKDFDLDNEDETYFGSAKGKTISRERALEEVAAHNEDPRDFLVENGRKSHYNAQSVLKWLGY